MFDKGFLETLLGSGETKIVKIDGKEYATKPVFNAALPEEFFVAHPLQVSTLSGLLDYIKSEIDEGDDDTRPQGQNCFLHVESPTEVTLQSSLYGVRKKRDVYLKAIAPEYEFRYGCFYPQATFVILLLTQFEATAERDALLKFVGTMRDEAIKTSVDDGVTQTATARTGIALVGETKVPSPVNLRPYRTFHEVEQPASPFIVRVQKGREAPEIALFEADGGRWRSEAIATIKAFLAEAVGKDLPIIA